jgi:sulfite reductase (NADPH) flavoprotein alpha-component
MSETLEVTAEVGTATEKAQGHAVYTRNNPYPAEVLANYLLTAEGSEKETRHIELAIEEGMTYTPGDAVGIIPENRRRAVDEVLEALGWFGDERVLDHYKVDIDLEEALRTRLAIGKLTRGSITQMAKLAPENDKLKSMTGAEGKALAEDYCYGREFVDALTDFPGVIQQPQQLFQVLARLTPRMYSIASSQALHPDNVQTTVRVVRYDSHGRERQGLCSGHLGERSPVGRTMPIFLHANGNFRLPEDSGAPVIMVGPGTGIAPFRAFLEERQATGAKGDNWLFFGEQRAALDYLYKDQFEGMQKDGFLTHLHTAFSRDQAKKIYVQDRITENAALLYEWLERGAYFYVCGDATRMAKDVETALLDSIAKGSNGTLEQANEYLAMMKKQKRYQRDVY